MCTYMYWMARSPCTMHTFQWLNFEFQASKFSAFFAAGIYTLLFIFKPILACFDQFQPVLQPFFGNFQHFCNFLIFMPELWQLYQQLFHGVNIITKDIYLTHSTAMKCTLFKKNFHCLCNPICSRLKVISFQCTSIGCFCSSGSYHPSDNKFCKELWGFLQSSSGPYNALYSAVKINTLCPWPLLQDFLLNSLKCFWIGINN